jgi:hypothetical protein
LVTLAAFTSSACAALVTRLSPPAFAWPAFVWQFVQADRPFASPEEKINAAILEKVGSSVGEGEGEGAGDGEGAAGEPPPPQAVAPITITSTTKAPLPASIFIEAPVSKTSSSTASANQVPASVGVKVA